MDPVVSVVIPMLNAASHLETLVASLAAQDFEEPWEIVAVDNGSDDDTASVALALLNSGLPPNVVRRAVVPMPTPRGYATPRNAGVRAAAAPLLAFCDADGAVDVGWLRCLTGALEHHPLVASHKVYTEDIKNRLVGELPTPQQGLPQIFGVQFALTAGLGCTREVFEALGGFDPHFDRGGEDADFSFRARRQLGIEPVVEQRAVYWTTLPSRRATLFSKGYRDGCSQARLYERHLGRHPEIPSGPAAPLTGLRRVAQRLLRRRRVRAHGQPSLPWEIGRLAGWAVWAVRLRLNFLRR